MRQWPTAFARGKCRGVMRPGGEGFTAEAAKSPGFTLWPPASWWVPTLPFLTARFFGGLAPVLGGCNPPPGLHPSPKSGGQTTNGWITTQAKWCWAARGDAWQTKGVLAPLPPHCLRTTQLVTTRTPSASILNPFQNISIKLNVGFFQ